MVRTQILLLSLVTLTAGRGAHAQILETDDAGYPMRVVVVWLEDGHTYDLSTTHLMPPTPGFPAPDSVLTLMDGGVALAGADGCNTDMSGFRWQPSCFTFAAPVTGSGIKGYALFLRAWRTNTPGQTKLWKRDVTAGTLWEPLTSGDITFGGAVASTTLTGNGRAFLHTQHRPGNNMFHSIWTTLTNEWEIVRQANFNGRVGATAMIDVPDVTAANLAVVRRHVFGTLFSAYTGPIRFLRNSWFEPGRDYDGDGLGEWLEMSLKTCDRPTAYDPSPGFRCAELSGCQDDPTGALCKASLRDTDHDGLRDDLEVFGYDQPNLEIARFGADPAQMDVFIELDTFDQNTSAPAACQGFEWLQAAYTNLNKIGGNEDRDFFADVQSVFDRAPASVNPNGQTGINLHFDVGVDNPDPTDTRWGNWGGGNTCLPAACTYSEAYYGLADCPPVPIDPSRRWVFFYGVDGPATSHGQSTYIAYGANETLAHVHEIGHLGRLGHAGPPGSAASLSNGDGNYRPNYPSRMNYKFGNVGGATVADSVAFAQVGFSSGAWTTPLSGMDARENCPIPDHNLGVLSLVGEAVFANPCGSDVNWDLMGPAPSGNSYMANYGRANRLKRATRLENYAAMGSAPDAAVVNGVLLAAYAKAAPGLAPVLTLRADGDGDCDQYPLPVRPAPPRGAYPGCLEHGLEVQPGTLEALAVAIEPGIVASGAPGVDGVIVMWNDAGTLNWGTMTASASATATEMTSTFVQRGVLASGASTQQSSVEPDLQRIPGTDETLAIYRATTGELRQASLPPGTTAWTTTAAARLADGTPLPLATAVSMVAMGTTVWLAGADGSQQVKLYRLVPGGGPASAWRWEWFLDATGARTGMRPALAVAPALDGSEDRLWLFFVNATVDGPVLSFARTVIGADYFEPPMRVAGKQVNPLPPAAVWDDRPGLGDRRGLRLFRVVAKELCSLSCASWAGSWATCNPVRLCEDRTTGYRVGSLWLTPFTRGPAPGIYADYNDWTGMQWGFCRGLAGRVADTPNTTSDYVPTSYRDQARCGPLPAYSEPRLGGMAIVSPPGPDDEALYPELYAAPEETDCSGI